MDAIAQVLFLMAALLFGVLIVARLLDALLRKLFQKSRQQSRTLQNQLTAGLQAKLQQEIAKRRQAKQQEAEAVPTFKVQDFAPMQEEAKVYREPGTLLQEQLETSREEAADMLQTANYETRRRLEEREIRQQEQQAYLRQAKIPGTEPQGVSVELTPAKMREAVILSEILGKPKALRRRKR